MSRNSSEPTEEPPLALVTERLLLRDLEVTDVEALVGYYGETQFHANLLARQRDPHYMRRRLRNAARYNHHYHWRDREDFTFAVCLRPSEQIVGVVSLGAAVPQGRDARIGWHFGSQYSGNGFATEAGKAALRFAFETIEIERIRGDCNENNAASIRVFTKLGMQPFQNGFIRNRVRAFQYRHTIPVVRYAVDRSTYAI